MKQCLTVPNKTEGDNLLAAPGIVSYVKKRNNFQIYVPCDKWSNLIPYKFEELCRTILVSSCALKKSIVISVVAFHFMKRRIKTYKPRPAQVGAIFKAQKELKDFKVPKYSLLVPEIPKTLDQCGALKRNPLVFSTSIVSKHRKIERGPFGEKKKSRKSLTQLKKLKGPFSLCRYCMLCRKRGKTFFGSVR